MSALIPRSAAASQARLSPGWGSGSAHFAFIAIKQGEEEGGEEEKKEEEQKEQEKQEAVKLQQKLAENRTQWLETTEKPL